MRFSRLLIVFVICFSAAAQSSTPANDSFISPSRPVPTGGAPGMRSQLLKAAADEKIYSVVFYTGDEVMSGLTDFALAKHITDAHFTAIGAVSGATLAWLDQGRKLYRPIAVTQQVEVLSLIGDIAEFNGKPVVHMHAVLGKPDGTTVGGHVFELHVSPTVEVFLTANTMSLKKRPDDGSGIKVIDPAP